MKKLAALFMHAGVQTKPQNARVSRNKGQTKDKRSFPAKTKTPRTPYPWAFAGFSAMVRVKL